MAEGAPVTMQYPVWLGHDNQLYYDQTGLEYHLVHELNYNQDDVPRVNQQIAQLLSVQPLIWKHAIRDTAAEMFEVIFMCISHDHLMRLFSLEDTAGSTALHYCGYYKRIDLMKLILDCVNEEESYQLLLKKNNWLKWTPLQVACIYDGHKDSVRLIMESVNQDMRYALLQIMDYHGCNPLHCIVLNGFTHTLNIIQESVTEQQWIDLVQLKSRRGYTTLHIAAYWNDDQPMQAIRDSVTNDDWLELLSTPQPPLDLAYIYDEDKFRQATRWINDFRATAKTQKALRETDRKDQITQIQNITETESLTVDQIQVLSPLSAQYIVPYMQVKSKRYGLILFSSANRSGAAAEADDLEQALEAEGCEVMKMEWYEARELQCMIDSAMDRIVGDCSLLIVCLMSHGSRGVLKGQGGEEIAVNDILHQFTYTLPESIPLIMVIQACQVFSTHGMLPPADDCESDPATPSSVLDPHQNKHIVLRRRHTALLMATVTGGLAYRGAFTGAIANEFREADGKKDICSMYIHAVTDPACREQCPEFRMTLDKTLILPPAINHSVTQD